MGILQRRKLATILLSLSLGIILLILPNACSNSGGNGTNSTSVSIPVNQLVGTVAINADTTTVFEFTPDLSQTAGPFSNVSINLASTINAIQVNTPVTLLDFFIRNAIANHIPEGQARVTAYIASEAEIDVVCNEGVQYGPFTLSLDSANQLLAVDPPTATATDATVQIINSGSMSICLVVESNVAANLNVNQLDFDFENCTEAPANIGGTWTGQFSCSNTPCADDPLQVVNLTISQNGDRATYTDGDGTFSGTVCGNKFNFTGGNVVVNGQFESGYEESGTFILTGPNSATKTSKWTDVNQACRGSCSDTLSR